MTIRDAPRRDVTPRCAQRRAFRHYRLTDSPRKVSPDGLLPHPPHAHRRVRRRDAVDARGLLAGGRRGTAGRRHDRVRAPARAAVPLRRVDRTGLHLVPVPRQPVLARRERRGRAVARRGLVAVGGRPHLHDRSSVGRELHRRHTGRRGGGRPQLRLLGRRRQQHGPGVARRLLRVGRGDRRPHGRGAPVAPVHPLHREPHAVILRHPIAARPRDPYGRRELPRPDRIRCVRRRRVEPRRERHPHPERRLHVPARECAARRTGVRENDRLALHPGGHHARVRAEGGRGRCDL